MPSTIPIGVELLDRVSGGQLTKGVHGIFCPDPFALTTLGTGLAHTKLALRKGLPTGRWCSIRRGGAS
jgi:hypothetical protein